MAVRLRDNGEVARMDQHAPWRNFNFAVQFMRFSHQNKAFI